MNDNESLKEFIGELKKIDKLVDDDNIKNELKDRINSLSNRLTKNKRTTKKSVKKTKK